ncbi:MAG: response regulator transcription factor [Vampirovibrio sp.]|nr:response regulator transcription factor [Vampirovibrio sp.]
MTSAEHAESKSVKVLLVDDHTILRQGLKQLLDATDAHVTVTGEAGDGQEAISLAFSLRPDVILMDINLPKVNGYEATKAILTGWPEARVVVLTNQDDPHVIKKFLDLGVKGFCLKDIPIGQMLDVIDGVMAGKTMPLSDELQHRLESLKDMPAEKLAEPLTDREKEVLTALSKGYTNQQLADLLVVSPKTVHNHLYNIYGKINVKNRSEAILWAIDAGLGEGR